jgi:tripartite-type tricarboxylate transporter receptor subunit TctC
LTIFCGLLAPVKAAAGYLDELRNAGQKAIRDPEFISQLRQGGVSPLDVSAAEFFEMMKMQNDRYAELIGALGISLT